MTRWTLFDYGVGNIHSLRKALERGGADVQVSRDADLLGDADVVVLPGVGAFQAVMETLEPARDALRRRHDEGRPTVGICIGMQALYDGSEEAPAVAGLGILPGTVRRLPPDAGKVPHMGWNTLHTEVQAAEAPSTASATDPVFSELGPEPYVYYVHSYAAPPGEGTIAVTDYGGPFTAAVRTGNTLAFQFHPEKSSTVGKAIIKNTIQDMEEHA